MTCIIEGFSDAIYYTLSPVYIDNNVKKSRAPLLYCLTSFVRLLGPALGYSLSSYSLRNFINPNLHPKITDEDPRWIGAWWQGYIFFGNVAPSRPIETLNFPLFSYLFYFYAALSYRHVLPGTHNNIIPQGSAKSCNQTETRNGKIENDS